jgi:S1-C subfamily serine protease
VRPAAAQRAERPSLGIVGGTVTRNATGPSTYLPDPYGAWVDGVAPRSPAAEAGIRQGDIIRSFNGHRVSTFEELDAYAVETIPGSRVTLGVFRNREMIEVELDL